ncbi:hypothetical protein [Robertmurraya kyonggiensis]|uniref:hypothetical protein n=1 Tax=Robertmurraya kyonggiensis TaxID=1037680 RepID=UPI0027BA2634|nr:hypothetical protein [Robertmurraya kyonggiensis]
MVEHERCGRFNYECFSLLITSDSILGETHFFNSKAKSGIKGNGFELIIVVDKVRRSCTKDVLITTTQ